MNIIPLKRGAFSLLLYLLWQLCSIARFGDNGFPTTMFGGENSSIPHSIANRKAIYHRLYLVAS